MIAMCMCKMWLSHVRSVECLVDGTRGEVTSQWMVEEKQWMVIGLVTDPHSYPVPFHHYPVCNADLVCIYTFISMYNMYHILESSQILEWDLMMSIEMAKVVHCRYGLAIRLMLHVPTPMFMCLAPPNVVMPGLWQCSVAMVASWVHMANWAVRLRKTNDNQEASLSLHHVFWAHPY